MVTVKEMLRCPNCDNIFLEIEDDHLHCIICTRDIDENGQLIEHPIGDVKVRSDGYGARTPTHRGRR